ncbi:RES domain protein [Candidatus Sulfopaludibacter sp. SbA4]|nr:RES domain protein [Candidatus Sulfopaludibacter sp. SbA4]
MALGRTPEPSKRFHAITLPISGTDRDWYRSHSTRHGAIYFGRNRAYRFDAPDGEYGVLYAGADRHVAFIESFQIAGIHPAVAESKLKEHSLSRIRIHGSVRLVNLAESGALTRIGGDARIFTASYSISQRWSRAIQTHPEQPDGILYRPRHDPARLAAAFFDAIAHEVTAETLGGWLDQRTALAEVLDTYGVALVS